jgi:hypothetical protein
MTENESIMETEIIDDYLAEGELPTDGWYQNLEDPTLVRYYHELNKRWGLETTVEFALLNELHNVKKDVKKQQLSINSIKFRTGLLVLVVFVVVVFVILASASSFLAASGQ